MKWFEDKRELKERTNPNFFCGPEWMINIFKDFDNDTYKFFDNLLGFSYFLNSCYLHDGDYRNGVKKFGADWRFYKRNLELVSIREKIKTRKVKRKLQATALFIFVVMPGVSNLSYYIAKKKGKLKK